MAKAKTPSEITAEYLNSIIYFEQDDTLIVLLPEGMSAEKSKLDDKKFDVTLTVEGLDVFKIKGLLGVPAGTDKIQILSAEEGKHFE